MWRWRREQYRIPQESQAPVRKAQPQNAEGIVTKRYAIILIATCAFAIALAGWIAVTHPNHCAQAGGVWVSGHCFDKSAIIESEGR